MEVRWRLDGRGLGLEEEVGCSSRGLIINGFQFSVTELSLSLSLSLSSVGSHLGWHTMDPLTNIIAHDTDHC